MQKRLAALVAVAVALFVLGAAAMVSAQAISYGGTFAAAYYNNPTLTGSPVISEFITNGLNIDWGTGSPRPDRPDFPVDNWSAQFAGTPVFNAGVYEFIVSSDDGVRVFIDGVLVLDRFVGRTFTTDTFQQTLSAGAHQLRVEYFDGVDRAALQVGWRQVTGSVQPTTVFPPGFPTATPFGTPFFTPGPSPTPPPPTATGLPAIPPGALSGTVIRAQVLLVRSGPFLGAPVAGRVLRGQTYQVIGRDTDARWFLLQLSSGQGWVWGYYLNVNGNEFNAPVASSFVTAGNPAALTGVVGQSQSGLRLRAAPDVTSAQIGRIPWGDILPILGRTDGGDWYQVVFRGTTGWVAAAYVDIIEGNAASVPIAG